MSARPWGKTGRVTLVDYFADTDVLVDGSPFPVGWCGARGLYGPWVAGLDHLVHGKRLPSLDAAVMWVLRRAAPDVWRAERPVVWRVKCHPRDEDGNTWHVIPADKPGQRIGFSRFGNPIGSADRWARAAALAGEADA